MTPDRDRDPRVVRFAEAIAVLIVGTPVLAVAAFLCALAAVAGFRVGWMLF